MIFPTPSVAGYNRALGCDTDNAGMFIPFHNVAEPYGPDTMPRKFAFQLLGLCFCYRAEIVSMSKVVLGAFESAVLCGSYFVFATVFIKRGNELGKFPDLLLF